MTKHADPMWNKLVDELCDRHDCHTVILYGSRARGDWRADSDYDVAGIRSEGPLVRDAREWEGSFLDAFIYPEDAVELWDDAMARLAGGRVLCQRDDVGRQLVARADTWAATPVAALTPDEAQMRATWLRKMAARIRPLGADDLEAHYRRAWVLFQSLEDYFALHTLRYPGSKQALAWLAAHDAPTHAAFGAALMPGAPDEAIDRLVDRLLASLPA